MKLYILLVILGGVNFSWASDVKATRCELNEEGLAINFKGGKISAFYVRVPSREIFVRTSFGKLFIDVIDIVDVEFDQYRAFKFNYVQRLEGGVIGELKHIRLEHLDHECFIKLSRVLRDLGLRQVTFKPKPPDTT